LPSRRHGRRGATGSFRGLVGGDLGIRGLTVERLLLAEQLLLFQRGGARFFIASSNRACR
jgi:hypothetical protein